VEIGGNGAQLKFDAYPGNPREREFLVTYADSKFKGQVVVSEYQPISGSLAEFFAALARDWRGWTA
jgi:uncharacterized protein DUF6228